MNFALRLATIATLSILSTNALAQTKPIRVRGTIEAVDGNTLSVKAREGQMVKVLVDDKTRYAIVIKASFEEVKPGAYLGIAALPQKDAPQKALEVVVFPEAMRGAGEGHRGWDLEPESTMTNATLSEAISSVKGQTITMKYKDGETKIDVSKDIPIVTFKPGAKTDATPSTVVFIGGQVQPDGTVTAASVTMGKDGVNPPM
ncbi:MAG: hypothetical protein K2P80_06640 [Beijerinckiaceae bacterium]|nr:hypothetical protein [Beijerinckiaceae bacterium]